MREHNHRPIVVLATVVRSRPPSVATRRHPAAPGALPGLAAALCLLAGLHADAAGAEPPSWSGIYPHLATFNDEGECGTGAVVPWAGRLWVVTYSPHRPAGSNDKLYEITPELRQIVRPESVGGTPASRLVHRESGQLFIGPYAIDAEGRVRVLRPEAMPGRLTGAARHLLDPAGRIYLATMEEGFYEVDVRTLAVRTLYPDAQGQKPGEGADLPGCHGKGLYSGQGVLVYANNGERGEAALTDPRSTSGALVEWDGSSWTLVRRSQFTEVTGPGGISGNADPANGPIWSVGWDHRSVILMVRDRGRWHGFRLPKASCSYDGAHGWNTEWPRIRDVGLEGKPDLLMTMHGMFWRFPVGFSAAKAAGIRPRSSYLKVIGDFCRWGDRLVFGCDDAAKSAFLNRRKAKGSAAGPGQSQSNLWIVDPGAPDRLGGTAASGAVWLEDPVRAGEASEPFLFAGWSRRSAFLANGGDADARFDLEVDLEGTGAWIPLRSIDVPARDSVWTEFLPEERGEWVRVRSSRDLASASAIFTWGEPARRGRDPDPLFAALARVSDGPTTAGLVRPAGDDRRVLQLAATTFDGREARDAGYHELGADLRLRPVADEKASAWLRENLAVPRDAVRVDAASVLVVDDAGRRWRLPKGPAAFDAIVAGGLCRLAREACTERDLFNCHGTIYELPAENAGGFAKIRPVGSHDLRIVDFCSWRGLLVLTGVRGDVSHPHAIRSEDGRAAVWLGAVDDLWRLGRPVGEGGPWRETEVRAGVASDPYLFAGYESKRLRLSHGATETVTFRVEVDPTGDGLWLAVRSFAVEPGRTVEHVFPPAFQARWIRFTADRATRATAWLVYE